MASIDRVSQQLKLVLVGFGNIGRSLARMILEKQEYLQKKFSMEIQVTGIIDVDYSIINMAGNGLNIREILSLKKTDLLNQNSNLSFEEILQKVPCDILVEMTPSTLNAQPGLSHIMQAFCYKKHVVTSNKSPLVLKYHDLKQLARQNKCEFRFEATVGGVIPLFTTVLNGLKANEISKIEGILNGTTNYILTRMSEGSSYTQALNDARKLGFCETNPSDDISGLDAARKLTIIANVLLDSNLSIDQVRRRSIEEISQAQIIDAHLNNKVTKHIALLEVTNNGVLASVEPKFIDLSNPLAHVKGIVNAIHIFTKFAGEITLSGIGAGPQEVSTTLLSDIIAIGIKVRNFSSKELKYHELPPRPLS
ncbi:MAG: homoserine dehydrogenase [Candidatus Helarchaeota archaeon]